MKFLNYLFIVICFSCHQKSNSSIAVTNGKISNTRDTLSTSNTYQIKEINLPFNSKQLNYSKRDKNGYYVYDKSFIKNKNNYTRTIGKYKSSDNVEITIVELKPNGDEHIDPIIKLYSFVKGKISDSLTVYENVYWEGTMKKEFEITQNKTIKISEKSTGVDFDENGKETTVSYKKTDTYKVTNKGHFVSNKWIGKYYFEATNKDNLKTSFDITIENLQNITIKYVGDEQSPEIYQNLEAEELTTDKIKIIFNEKYEEMGEIYIEKNKDNYSISGQVIYFINPGNESYPLKKIK